MIIEFQAEYPVECLLNAYNADKATTDKIARFITSEEESIEHYDNSFILEQLNADVNDGLWRIVNTNRNEFFSANNKIKILKDGPVPKIRVYTRMCILSNNDMILIIHKLNQLSNKFPGVRPTLDEISKIMKKDVPNLKFED